MDHMKPGSSQSRKLIGKIAGCNLSLLAFALVSLAFPAAAPATDGGTPKAAGPGDGWESPARLKPYVKPAPASSPASDEQKPSTTPSLTDSNSKEIDAAVRSIYSEGGPDVLRLRRDKKAAKRLAKYHWLEKAADANPRVIEAITNWKAAAKILAQHPRLSEIAQADHYVCRRITKWKSAARLLAKNSEVKEVAGFDPDGLYTAIERDRKIIRILSRNPMFDQMIVDNPDLGRVIAKYM